MIPVLIDKLDTFQLVRDKIAYILANESLNQQQLAEDDDKDPNLWKLRVYIERAEPWETWLNEQTDKTPVVNVWFDSSTFDKHASAAIEEQTCDGVFNIDLYGVGVNTTSDDGQITGDMESSANVQNAAKLVRNILMSAPYMYLDMRGTVGMRWIDSITSYQPQFDNRQVQRVNAMRIRVSVTFLEWSPRAEEGILKEVYVTIKRASDGRVLAEAEYDYE